MWLCWFHPSGCMIPLCNVIYVFGWVFSLIYTFEWNVKHSLKLLVASWYCCTFLCQLCYWSIDVFHWTVPHLLHLLRTLRVTVVSHCGPRTGSVNYKGQDINTLFLRNAFAEMPLVWRSAGFESVGAHFGFYNWILTGCSILHWFLYPLYLFQPLTFQVPWTNCFSVIQVSNW